MDKEQQNNLNKEDIIKKREEMVIKLATYEKKEKLWKNIWIIILASSLTIFFFIMYIYMEDGNDITIPLIILASISIPVLLIYLIYHSSYNNLRNRITVIDSAYGLDISDKSVSSIEDSSKPPVSGINYVLSGRYKNYAIKNIGNGLIIGGKKIENNISSYTIIDETNIDKYSFEKGVLGVALFGGIGLVAGLNGETRKQYIIDIVWTDGEELEDGGKSLILIDYEYFKVFMKCMV